eukprot:TRINITY_DN6023_c0_g2_i4.p1 TRINITY_DN6023_c0_g2~~TRINITY_DN6023_c0_g2_i4.p1  ORF type:complete len:615 (-),score=73.75 TRINITY_DN6023_c0_g2_i4:38-1882(-)
MSSGGVPGHQQDSFSRSPEWTHLEKEISQLKQEDLPQQRQNPVPVQSEIPLPIRANTAPPKTLVRFLQSSSPVLVREDIRYDEQYQQFYREYHGPHHLPPPIEENSILQEIGRGQFQNTHAPTADSEEDPVKQLERITIGGNNGGQQQQPFHQPISPMGSNPGTPAPDINMVLQLASQNRVLNSISPPIQPGTPTPINGMGGVNQVDQTMNALGNAQQIASVFAAANAAGWGNNMFGQTTNFGVNPASALLEAIGGGVSNNSTGNNVSSPNIPASPTAAVVANGNTGGGNRSNRGGNRRGGRGRHHNDAGDDPTIQYNERYPTPQDIVGHVMEVAKDQYGCRFLQKMMDSDGKVAVDYIFPEMVDHTVDLMKDPFGNYLIQKILEVCSEEQRTEILRMTTKNGELVSAALNTHGTRAVQKLIETLKTQEQIDLVIGAFEPGVVDLIMDLNGNHVIQKCLQKLGSQTSRFVYDACCKQIKEIAKHRHGCCVLQRCIDFATPEQKRELVVRISAHSLELAQDQFGNYVIQYVLDIGDPEATATVMKQLEGDYVELSKQKFSSNVVEKCLKMHQVGIETEREQIIKELSESEVLSKLLQIAESNRNRKGKKRKKSTK